MQGSLVRNEALLNAVVAGMARMPAVDCAVCVPFPYLAQAQQLLRGSQVKWGAQDVHQMDKGAYTGEVAASMLCDFGCRYVIVGHSERRSLYGESSRLVAEKFAAAQKAGLLPILCVGETLERRESGITEAVVVEQLDAVIKLLGVQSLRNAVLAYEPVWAIGTGLTPTPADVAEVHGFIRQRLGQRFGGEGAGIRILYGGSVKPANARELMTVVHVSGALVGGASLKAEDFLGIAAVYK